MNVSSVRRSMGLLYMIIFAIAVAAAAAKLPEATSTLLKMHRLYVRQPPHDMTLYDVLQVSPNATLVELTKQYRKLSRKHHPDKQVANGRPIQVSQNELRKVQEAYEILKDDTTRLPYHQYGISDPDIAAVTMVGSPKDRRIALRNSDNPAQAELFELMGYERDEYGDLPNMDETPYYQGHDHDDSDTDASHTKRVSFIAARLVERIRPLVEGAVDEQIIAHVVAEECDRLKSLPMGAQILRCTGRAYRHVGEVFLAKRVERINPFDLSGGIGHRWRDAKNVLEATFFGGRVIVTEKIWNRQHKMQQKKKERERKGRWQNPWDLNNSGNSDDEYDVDMLLGGDDDEFDQHVDFDLDSDQEIREKERLRARQAMMSSLRIEALWKISKIDLDRTVREACESILADANCFFPSHILPTSEGTFVDSTAIDGWVSSYSKCTVPTHIVQERAAAAMITIGDIMVHCSKQGTAWKSSK